MIEPCFFHCSSSQFFVDCDVISDLTQVSPLLFICRARIIDCFGVVMRFQRIKLMEWFCKWSRSKLLMDDVTDSLSSPPLFALNGRDGGHSVPTSCKDSVQCSAVPGRRLRGGEQAYVLMEKSLEVPMIELIPDQSLLVSLSVNRCPFLTSCTLRFGAGPQTPGRGSSPGLTRAKPHRKVGTPLPIKVVCPVVSQVTLIDESTPHEQPVVTAGADHTHTQNIK